MRNTMKRKKIIRLIFFWVLLPISLITVLAAWFPLYVSEELGLDDLWAGIKYFYLGQEDKEF